MRDKYRKGKDYKGTFCKKFPYNLKSRAAALPPFYFATLLQNMKSFERV